MSPVILFHSGPAAPLWQGWIGLPMWCALVSFLPVNSGRCTSTVLGEGESPPFIGWCWPNSNWVVTCRPGVGFCKIGLALMAMACASPFIIFQGYCSGHCWQCPPVSGVRGDHKSYQSSGPGPSLLTGWCMDLATSCPS